MEEVGGLARTSTHPGMDSLRFYGLVAAGSAALLGTYFLLRRKPKTPEELERMLAPREMEITTLFCDLRNYSLFASQNAFNRS